MKKIYLLPLLLFAMSVLNARNTYAQSFEISAKNPIKEKVNVFPNPLNEGSKLTITSKSGRSKIVTMYNALGDTVLFKALTGNQLDTSALTPGIYILSVQIADFAPHKQKVVIH